PADIVIRTTEAGKPYLSGNGLEDLESLPELSVAHADGEAVAIAAPAGVAVGIDFERPASIDAANLLTAGFSDGERTALFGTGHAVTRVVQAWCAKEAAAKCLGTGFDGQPTNFRVRGLDESGRADVEVGEFVFGVCTGRSETAVLAVACLTAP